MDINNIQGLLNQVATINKKNAEILDATGGRFNIFRICGVNHYENTHSSILAELLNPQGSHSLKKQFLDAFLETIGKSFTLKDFDTTNATVHTEYVTDNGRIDILIKDHKKNAIMIVRLRNTLNIIKYITLLSLAARLPNKVQEM